MISKILVANRGEIAMRVMQTCKDMGIRTVAVYSEADREALHVKQADEAWPIGEAASSESYLVIDKIIDVAKKSGADAIHPGYGFLSENSGFARRCEKENIIFIGPSNESIELMGDKTKARELAEKHNIPLPPGDTTAFTNIDQARATAQRIGFPVLVKAAAGGGGKGMRIINNEDEFESGIRAAKSEALNAFNDDRVYVEKYLEEPHHIEVQIIADKHGNTLHLYDRECSIQRRHQKVVEEAPSAFIDDELREKITQTAIKAAKACKYYSAGTVEFLVDKHKNFYFLEMNTRLQVEHPVTELITDLDLVELQIRVANGEKLPLVQDDIRIRGHSIECRMSAEDPADNFMPSTGRVTRFRPSLGAGIRLDSAIDEGKEVSINYDPMFAKLISFGTDRNQAINRMRRALRDFEIGGIKTTIPFCEYVMRHEAFLGGNYDTHFVKNHYENEKMGWLNRGEEMDAVSVTAALIRYLDVNKTEAGTLDIVEANGTFSGEWWRNRRNK